MWGMCPVHSIIHAQPEHAVLIAPLLRTVDLREIAAMTPLRPSHALINAVRDSMMAWSWFHDERIVAIFGVSSTSLVTQSGSPWMVATPEIVRHRFYFIRNCRMYVNYMRSMFPFLWNCAAADNHDTLRWLEWLGFHIGDPEPMGRKLEPFRRFEILGGSRACASLSLH